MKIICIGRNYVKHIEELKNEVPAEPVVFMKPDSALLLNNRPFYLPDFSQNMHHEVELVVRINKLGRNIEPRFASRYYNEIGLGIDFTARDLQDELRAKGLPWEKSKAFDQSAVVSTQFLSTSSFDNINNIAFKLDINGNTVQEGNSTHMIFRIDDIIAHVSKYFTLKIGDLIFTGTPAGVGKVNIGDQLQGYIENTKMFDFLVK